MVTMAKLITFESASPSLSPFNRSQCFQRRIQGQVPRQRYFLAPTGSEVEVAIITWVALCPFSFAGQDQYEEQITVGAGIPVFIPICNPLSLSVLRPVLCLASYHSLWHDMLIGHYMAEMKWF